MPTVPTLFHLDEVRSHETLYHARWLEFLRSPALFAGIYELPIGCIDPQEPHREDELYLVMSGRAAIRIQGTDYPVAASDAAPLAGKAWHGAHPGNLIYIPAHVPHHFHSIEAPLVLVVLFSTAAAPARSAYRGPYVIDLDALAQPGALDQPSANECLRVAALTGTRFDLPTGVTTTLGRHPADQVYVNLAGHGDLLMAGGSQQIEPGDILFMPAGTEHAFHPTAAGLHLFAMASATASSHNPAHS